MSKEISVVLPAYNEEKNIESLVLSINKYLRPRFKTYEIVVVNDGSHDSTADIVIKMSKKFKNVRLISHGKNRGYGAALRTGFMGSKGKLVFYTDADNQYRITGLDKLMNHIDEYDIVAGYRLNHSDPLTRVITSHVYNFIIWILFGLNIKDVDCSFKLYKRKVFDSIKLRCNTGLIDAEVLIKARKKGFTIYQLGVKHYPRTKGKSIYEIGNRNKLFAFVSPSVPINIFKEVKKYWAELH